MTLGYTEAGTIASYATGVEPPGGYAHTGHGRDCAEGSGVLAALFTAADDDEAAAIESAAVKAGLLLKCQECGYGVGGSGDTCQACGAEITALVAGTGRETGP